MAALPPEFRLSADFTAPERWAQPERPPVAPEHQTESLHASSGTSLIGHHGIEVFGQGIHGPGLPGCGMPGDHRQAHDPRKNHQEYYVSLEFQNQVPTVSGHPSQRTPAGRFLFPTVFLLLSLFGFPNLTKCRKQEMHSAFPEMSRNSLETGFLRVCPF